MSVFDRLRQSGLEVPLRNYLFSSVFFLTNCEVLVGLLGVGEELTFISREWPVHQGSNSRIGKNDCGCSIEKRLR